ncbi:co-chaperone GroES [Candidatus Babeliales bacterium]|nr:co-chaperone GroES [Candidatus Babeliales bacterium]
MFDKIRPLHDRVLVERVEQEEKTAGGLYIPENAKEKAQTGKVVSVGSGRLAADGTRVPLQVKVGDIVFFGKYSGTEAGKDHLVIKEDDILGIVEK